MAAAFAFWFIPATLVALIAVAKGRGGCGWFIYAFLLWPIALLHVLLIWRRPIS
jgi:hypothetical protein